MNWGSPLKMHINNQTTNIINELCKEVKNIEIHWTSLTFDHTHFFAIKI